MAPGSSLGSTLQCPERTLSLRHRARSWPHRLPDARPPRRESARPPGLAGLTPPPLAQSDCRRGVPRTPLRSLVQKCIIGLVPLDEYGPNRTCGCGHEQMAPRTAWASHSTQLREEPQEGLHALLTRLVQRVCGQHVVRLCTWHFGPGPCHPHV